MSILLLRPFSDAPRAIAWLCLTVIAGAAWMFLFFRGGGEAFASLCQPYGQAWALRDAGLAFVLWAAMALGMMLPNASPMISTYLDIAETARAKGMAVVPAVVLAAGYGAVWLGFAATTTLLQFAIQTWKPLSGEAAAGVLLVGAGAYQFSRLKHACLSKCRSPMPYFLAHWSERAKGVFAIGLRQGLHCLGCCWALMLIAGIAGLMNPIWMAAAGLLLLLERTLTQPWALLYGIGAGLIAAGLAEIAIFLESFNAIW
jgi:predicted metal-binding membrane protein